jgi:EF-hand domain pair
MEPGKSSVLASHSSPLAIGCCKLTTSSLSMICLVCDRTIRYTEFLAASLETQGPICEERLAEAFDRIDSHDRGYISVQSLQELLGYDFPVDEIEDIIREVDIDKAGEISYNVFLDMFDQRGLAGDASRTDSKNGIFGLFIKSEVSFNKRDEPGSIDLDGVKAITPLYGSERSAVSDISGDDGDFQGEDAYARTNFLESKQLSERRFEAFHADAPTSPSNGHHTRVISADV